MTNSSGIYNELHIACRRWVFSPAGRLGELLEKLIKKMQSLARPRIVSSLFKGRAACGVNESIRCARASTSLALRMHITRATLAVSNVFASHLLIACRCSSMLRKTYLPSLPASAFVLTARSASLERTSDVYFPNAKLAIHNNSPLRK